MPLELQALRTPVRHLIESGQIITVKDETQQVSGAFKYRGVIHRLRSIPPYTPVFTASTGNHGLAVALASSQAGMKATIIIPETADAYKQHLIQSTGAKVIVFGATLREAINEGKGRAGQAGGMWLSGFDDEAVVQGYRPLIRELLEDSPDIEVIAIPIGGGGLLAAALLEASAHVEIVAVQSESSQSLAVSVLAGVRTYYELTPGIADGLMVPEIGEIALRAAQERAPRITTVSDSHIREAMRMLWDQAGIRAEPSGATAVASALHYTDSRRIACIITGGNISTEQHRLLTAL
jgi:threonine dehydratase